MKRRRWTTGRKIWGNVAPLLVAAPAMGVGLWQWQRLHNPFHWSVLIWYAAALILAWVGAVFLGLSGNRSMRRAQERELMSIDDKLPEPRMFVGMATAGFSSVWDPHEDVGFLIVERETLRFVGESKRFELSRSAIKSARLAPNAHSWLGLGGWVALNGIVDNKPIQLLLEPRDRDNLLANRRLRPALRAALDQWRVTGEFKLSPNKK